MRVQSRGLALVGLLALGVVAFAVLEGRMTVAQAGGRAAATLVVLVLADRVLLPISRMLVGPPARGVERVARTDYTP